MKKFLLVFVLVALVFPAISVSADTGAGIILGDPTGISVLFGNRVALGAAWDIEDFLHLHGDLWMVRGSFIDPVEGYIGLGAKVQLFDVNANGKDGKDTVGVGVRVPFGLQWYFLPEWELFGEFVPGIGIVPDTDFDFDAGIGIRYHF